MDSTISNDEELIINELSKDKNIDKRIWETMAPSISWNDDVKSAIAISLFSGSNKNTPSSHQIRSSIINILLLGDQETIKSQFFTTAEKISSQSVSIDCKESENLIDLFIQADDGICFITNLDQMKEKDQILLKQVIEQSISICKEDKITKLNTRCSIIAACSPIHAQYDFSLSFNENLDLSDHLLSHFDLLLFIRNEDKEEEGQNHSEIEKIDQNILKKYIQFARSNFKPQLNDNICIQKITSFYIKMREVCSSKISVRNLESVIRIAEVHARMCLRQNVTMNDVNFSIGLFSRSFVSAQKGEIKELWTNALSEYMKL